MNFASSPIRLDLVALSVMLAAGSVAAQQTANNYRPIQAGVKNAGTYHMASQTWTRPPSSSSALGPDTLYSNVAPSGYYYGAPSDDVLIDEGRIPSLSSEGSSDHYLINGLQFGYCTDEVANLVLSFQFFDSYAPCSRPDTCPAGDLFVTGLPSTATFGTQACWLVTFDLAGTSSEFTMIADGGDAFFDANPQNDSFGSFVRLSGYSGPNTGLLLAGDPGAAPFGAGTTPSWGFPAGPGTGLGQQDFFWLESQTANPGCYFFGGYPVGPWAGFWLATFGEPYTPECTDVYCGAGQANSVSTGGGRLESLGGFGTQAATFLIADVPDQPGLLYAGVNQIQLPFGCGERCIGGSTIRGSVLFPTGNQAIASFDMSQPNAVNIQYWYRDPANFGACGGAFNLSNALGPCGPAPSASDGGSGPSSGGWQPFDRGTIASLDLDAHRDEFRRRAEAEGYVVSDQVARQVVGETILQVDLVANLDLGSDRDFLGFRSLVRSLHFGLRPDGTVVELASTDALSEVQDDQLTVHRETEFQLAATRLMPSFAGHHRIHEDVTGRLPGLADALRAVAASGGAITLQELVSTADLVELRGVRDLIDLQGNVQRVDLASPHGIPVHGFCECVGDCLVQHLSQITAVEIACIGAGSVACGFVCWWTAGAACLSCLEVVFAGCTAGTATGALLACMAGCF